METCRILSVLPLTEAHREYLTIQAQGRNVDCTFTYRSFNSVTVEDIRRADVLIGNASPVLLREAQTEGAHLSWVQLNSAGADAYIPAEVLPEKTLLTCSSGAYGLSVAEHMLTMTMALIRHFDAYARQQFRHAWKTGRPVTSIAESTVLVLGLGDIGGRYARMCKALGAKVIGVRRTPNAEKPDYLDVQVAIDALDDFLPQADIVAMVLPGGKATEHIMDERRLRLMKKGAYLINDGRGNAIDPDALKKVLQEGHLGGAGLDVTEPEPLPKEDELWDMDNVIITPHIAGQFLLASTFERIVKIAGENLHAYVTGGEMKHIVNRSVGY